MVDCTTDVQTPADDSDDNENDEPANNAHNRQRKKYGSADTMRKKLTKQRQAELLKKKQEKDKAKAQAAANKDKPDSTNRSKPHRSKDKASYPDQVKSSKKG